MPPPKNLNYICKIAFTLAEILITLGIIGVVAALTLPNLIADYQKNTAAVRLKYAYSVLYQAVKLSEVDNGPIEYWELESTQGSSAINATKNYVEKYFTPYMKVVKKDNLTTSSAPYEYGYYTKNGEYISGGGHTLYSIALNNGIYLHFNANFGIADTITVRIDINGRQKPNIMGRDTFFAYVYPNFSLRGEGLPRTTLINLCQVNDRTSQELCGAIIQMDSWEIKDDYPW